jgi:hypothetical protein
LSGLSSAYIEYVSSLAYFGGSPAVSIRNWNYSKAAPRKAGGIKAICNAFPISMHNSDIYASQFRTYFAVGSNITSTDDFLTAVQNLESNDDGLWICYELAEPIEIQLTPTEVRSLLGQNNIFADTGDTACEYRADPDLYIQKKMPEVPVDDVQINGTSIVSDGVANVPKADTNTLGVARVNYQYGVGFYGASDILAVSPATSAQVKNGTECRRPVAPERQHESAFYGLAKAAGDTTQSQSSNAVGNYTDTAKGKIQSMLGIADLIGNSEGATASKAYSVGDVLLHDGKLYKVTASIAQGSAIVPNTNCTQTTIIDLLRGV